MSLIDIAAHFHCDTPEILEDLHHVAKSVRPEKELVMLPAQCKKCRFIFRERQDRQKMKKPSKCPKCKSERILAPVFTIRKKEK